MTADQLNAIIRDWLDSEDPTHWGEFEKRLDRAITRSGALSELAALDGETMDLPCKSESKEVTA